LDKPPFSITGEKRDCLFYKLSYFYSDHCKHCSVSKQAKTCSKGIVESLHSSKMWSYNSLSIFLKKHLDSMRYRAMYPSAGSDNRISPRCFLTTGLNIPLPDKKEKLSSSIVQSSLSMSIFSVPKAHILAKFHSLL
jgi:hypothetical protein